MHEQTNRASLASHRLEVVAASLAAPNDLARLGELRARLKGVDESLQEALQGIQEKDPARLEAAIQKFRQSYQPVRESAKRPTS